MKMMTMMMMMTGHQCKRGTLWVDQQEGGGEISKHIYIYEGSIIKPTNAV
jgi:hypothetical protein